MNDKRFALIIANYEYQDPDFRQLVAPAQYAEALARVLKDPAVGGFEVQTLLNKPWYEVNPAIETFFADRSPEDLLLLYFSGHGVKDEWGQRSVNRAGNCCHSCDGRANHLGTVLHVHVGEPVGTRVIVRIERAFVPKDRAESSDREWVVVAVLPGSTVKINMRK